MSETRRVCEFAGAVEPPDYGFVLRTFLTPSRG